MEVRQVSHYRAFEEIGKGVSGTVYKAWDDRQQRPAAIKILRPSAGTELSRKMLSTARALIHAPHPNMATIYDVGEEDGSAYIISEVVDGVSLKEIFLKRRQADYDFLDLCIQIAIALKDIHSMKLVHGNLKPSNIFLCDDGEVKLLDAGLSPFIGFQLDPEFVAPYEAYHYIAPEQIEGREISARTDLFALGTIMYQFHAESPPFTGNNENALAKAILDSTPDCAGLRKKSVPGDQVLLIEKLLAKEPRDRLTGANELLVTLKAMKAFAEDYSRIEETLNTPKKQPKYITYSALAVLFIILWLLIASFRK